MIKNILHLEIKCDKALDFLFDLNETSDILGATLDIKSIDFIIVTIYLNKTYKNKILKNKFFFKWSDVISMNYTTTDISAEVLDD